MEEMRYCKRFGYYVPIEFCKKNGGYDYTNPDFSVEPGLGPKEYEALKVFIDFIKKLQHDGQELSRVPGAKTHCIE